ncbi:pneumococcal serine-rich repeat protein [Ixodes scapularis]
MDATDDPGGGSGAVAQAPRVQTADAGTQTRLRPPILVRQLLRRARPKKTQRRKRETKLSLSLRRAQRPPSPPELSSVVFEAPGDASLASERRKRKVARPPEGPSSSSASMVGNVASPTRQQGNGKAPPPFRDDAFASDGILVGVATGRNVAQPFIDAASTSPGCSELPEVAGADETNFTNRVTEGWVCAAVLSGVEEPPMSPAIADTATPVVGREKCDTEPPHAPARAVPPQSPGTLRDGAGFEAAQPHVDVTTATASVTAVAAIAATPASEHDAALPPTERTFASVSASEVGNVAKPARDRKERVAPQPSSEGKPTVKATWTLLTDEWMDPPSPEVAAVVGSEADNRSELRRSVSTESGASEAVGYVSFSDASSMDTFPCAPAGRRFSQGKKKSPRTTSSSKSKKKPLLVSMAGLLKKREQASPWKEATARPEVCVVRLTRLTDEEIAKWRRDSTSNVTRFPQRGSSSDDDEALIIIRKKKHGKRKKDCLNEAGPSEIRKSRRPEDDVPKGEVGAHGSEGRRGAKRRSSVASPTRRLSVETLYTTSGAEERVQTKQMASQLASSRAPYTLEKSAGDGIAKKSSEEARKAVPEKKRKGVAENAKVKSVERRKEVDEAGENRSLQEGGAGEDLAKAVECSELRKANSTRDGGKDSLAKGPTVGPQVGISADSPLGGSVGDGPAKTKPREEKVSGEKGTTAKAKHKEAKTKTASKVLQKPMLQKPMLQKPMLQKPMLQKPMFQKLMLQKLMLQKSTLQKLMLQKPMLQKATLQKPNAPKAGAPKAGAPKAGAPKAGAPKAGAPKAGASRADVPKANAPKSVTPKADIPKAVAQKALAHKAVAAKPNALKATTSKSKTLKADAPKTAAPKVDAPKADAPKTDAPKTDAPKTAPKTAAPKADAAKANAAKANAAKANAAKADAAKADAAKADAPKANAAKADAAKADAAKTDAAKADVAKADAAKAHAAKVDVAKVDAAKDDGAKDDGAKDGAAKDDAARNNGSDLPKPTAIAERLETKSTLSESNLSAAPALGPSAFETSDANADDEKDVEGSDLSDMDDFFDDFENAGQWITVDEAGEESDSSQELFASQGELSCASVKSAPDSGSAEVFGSNETPEACKGDPASARGQDEPTTSGAEHCPSGHHACDSVVISSSQQVEVPKEVDGSGPCTKSTLIEDWRLEVSKPKDFATSPGDVGKDCGKHNRRKMNVPVALQSGVKGLASAVETNKHSAAEKASCLGRIHNGRSRSAAHLLLLLLLLLDDSSSSSCSSSSVSSCGSSSSDDEDCFYVPHEFDCLFGPPPKRPKIETYLDTVHEYSMQRQSREALLKQLEMSRQLTHKAAAEESSESDDDPSAAAEAVAKNGGELEARFFSSSNPWLKNPALGITNKTDADDEPALDSESENGGDESIVEGVSSNGGEPTLPLLERKREETNAAVSGADIDQGTSDFMVPEEAKNSSNEAVTGSSGASKEESFSDPNKKSHSPDKSSLPGTSRAADKVERRKKKKVSDRAADIEELFDTFSRRKQKKKESLLKKRGFEVESSTERKTAKDLTSRKDSVAAEGPSEQLDEGLERRQTLADLEAFEKENTPKQKKTRVARDEPSKKTPVVSDKVEVDPTKFLQVKQTSLKSQVPDLQGAADEALDDEEGEEEQAVTIAEAFADDDVISAFREEKKAQVKRDAPEVIDNYLPGWGSWGGTGIKVNKKKRRRFLVKPPPAPPRKDRTLGNVIINEKNNEKCASHQVNSLPFPFNNVSQFEAAISHPVGSTWNPETAFRDLTAPKVVTKLGQVIDPINADSVVLKKRAAQVPDKLPEKKQKQTKRKRK